MRCLLTFLAFVIFTACGTENRTIGTSTPDTAVPDAGVDSQASSPDLGCPGSVQEETFLQSKRKVDILMVVDPSGSMMDEKIRLLSTAEVFAQNTITKEADFHFGVVSLSPDSAGSIPLGQLLGEPAYLDSAALGSDPATLIAQEYKSRIELAEDGAFGVEQGFDALITALTPTNKTNQGFRRADAALEILFFTDEDDGSGASLQDTIDFLATLEPGQGRTVRVHGLLPQSCASETFPRWTGLTMATGGTVHDLCLSDYTPAVAELTARLFSLDEFKLQHATSDPETMIVTVDGQSASYSYLPSGSVKLDEAPAVGATVKVKYCVGD